MKYIKKFDTHAEYQAAESSLILPNVSFCKDTPNEVHYNPLRCDETSVYEIVGIPSYPSEIDGDTTSFDISLNYKRTDTDTACTETITEGSDTVTVECGANPSTSESRTVSGTVTWNGNEISYSVTQTKYTVDCTSKAIATTYDYVEIGGLKWATKNIGAIDVTDYGQYFQWGDVSGYTREQARNQCKYFGWADYKYGNGTSEPGDTGMTKYNNTDNKTVLEATDDAATVNMGSGWRMPTTAEFQALRDAVNTGWTASYNDSGVAGLVLTSKADSSVKLFFPAAGYCRNGTMSNGGNNSMYWSSSLYTSGKQHAYYLNCFSGGYWKWQGGMTRIDGYPVRGVLADS